MKVTMKYDQGVKKEEVVILEVCEKELDKMVKKEYELRLAEITDDEIVEKRTPTEIIDESNRKEYNAWRRYHRHIAILANNFTGDELNLMDILADYSEIEKHQKQADYEDMCQRLRQLLKPEQAEMIIAICLDRMAVNDYASNIGDELKNVSKRFVRVKKKLRDIL
jgi:hypothetical protein